MAASADQTKSFHIKTANWPTLFTFHSL